MAAGASFRWEVPPTVIRANLVSYEDRIIAGIGLLADAFSARMEAYAKANASWTDRTGAARQGLRGFAVKEATRVVLYLVGSVKHNIWLELGNSRGMAPRPIIVPTLQQHYQPLMQAVRQLVGGR